MSAVKSSSFAVEGYIWKWPSHLVEKNHKSCIRRNFTPWFIFIHKGLFACRWGTSGRWGTPVKWGTPPSRGRLHLYLKRSLRDRKHQEAEICQCYRTSWADVIIYFLFFLFTFFFLFLLWSANDLNFVRLLVCL